MQVSSFLASPLGRAPGDRQGCHHGLCFMHWRQGRAAASCGPTIAVDFIGKSGPRRFGMSIAIPRCFRHKPYVCPLCRKGFTVRQLLPGLHETVELWLDGGFVGRHVGGEAGFALPVSRGEVAIALRVRNTAANYYYAGTSFWGGTPLPSGLTAAPCLCAGPQSLVANPGAATETASRWGTE